MEYSSKRQQKFSLNESRRIRLKSQHPFSLNDTPTEEVCQLLAPQRNSTVAIVTPCIPIDSFRFNRLIAIIFAYFNRKNNRYNRFVRAYRNCGWLAKICKFFNKF